MSSWSRWIYSASALLFGVLLLSKLPLGFDFQTRMKKENERGVEVQEKYQYKQGNGHLTNRSLNKLWKRCDQRPTKMKFQLIGGTCQQSHQFQDDNFNCKDYVPIIYPVDITFNEGKLKSYGGKGGKGGKGRLYNNLFPKVFKAKHSFDVITVGNNQLFPSDTKVTITGGKSGVIYQEFSFHTSCSKNLFIGNTFGILKVIGFTNGYQGSVKGSVEEKSSIPSLPPIPTTSAFPSLMPSNTPSCPNLLKGKIGRSNKSASSLMIQSISKLSTCIQKAHEKSYIGFNVLTQHSSRTRKCVFFNRSHLLPIEHIKQLRSAKDYQRKDNTVSYVMPLSDTCEYIV